MTDPQIAASRILAMKYTPGISEEERARRVQAKAEDRAARQHAEQRVEAAHRLIEASSGPVKTVRELHGPVLREYSAELACRGCDRGCNCDSVRWPCSTWDALAGEDPASDDRIMTIAEGRALLNRERGSR